MPWGAIPEERETLQKSCKRHSGEEMATEQKSVAAAVYKAVREPVEALGYSIWDLDYVKEGSEWYLRITIDREKGVDLDDCEKVMRLVDPIITELDPVEGAYHLEVSSPGLERELRTPEHFQKSLGEEIVLKLFTPVEGRKEWKGRLISAEEDGTVHLKAENRELTIEKKKISRANIYFDFDGMDSEEQEPADLSEKEENRKVK